MTMTRYRSPFLTRPFNHHESAGINKPVSPVNSKTQLIMISYYNFMAPMLNVIQSFFYNWKYRNEILSCFSVFAISLSLMKKNNELMEIYQIFL